MRNVSTPLTRLAIAVAAAAYILQQIPNSLPRRLQEKISAQLAEMDYVHANSTRISASVRKVLRFPADNLRLSLDRWEPRIDVLRLDAGRDPEQPERLNILLQYRVRVTRNTELLSFSLNLVEG